MSLSNMEDQGDPVNHVSDFIDTFIRKQGVRCKTRYPEAVTPISRIIPIKSRKEDKIIIIFKLVS